MLESRLSAIEMFARINHMVVTFVRDWILEWFSITLILADEIYIAAEIYYFNVALFVP